MRTPAKSVPAAMIFDHVASVRSRLRRHRDPSLYAIEGLPGVFSSCPLRERGQAGRITASLGDAIIVLRRAEEVEAEMALAGFILEAPRTDSTPGATKALIDIIFSAARIAQERREGLDGPDGPIEPPEAPSDEIEAYDGIPDALGGSTPGE